MGLLYKVLVEYFSSTELRALFCRSVEQIEAEDREFHPDFVKICSVADTTLTNVERWLVAASLGPQHQDVLDGIHESITIFRHVGAMWHVRVEYDRALCSEGITETAKKMREDEHDMALVATYTFHPLCLHERCWSPGCRATCAVA